MTKSKNPVILNIIIHHRQNPLESKFIDVSEEHTAAHLQDREVSRANKQSNVETVHSSEAWVNFYKTARCSVSGNPLLCVFGHI
jgi:predicted membrane GTPase involved in stress response